ncbi:MAG: AAA family ATPase, partial [Propionibacteriaceae bacterium]|nr:AAA family ATPase [Propionibacteriaceae bacterium]
MKNNRVLRSPLLFIGVAMVLFFIILSALSNSGGYTEKSISEVVALINSSEPLKEVILTDGEQTIKIETASNPPAKIRSVWVASQSDALVQRLNERVAQKTLTSWKGENPQPSIWSTLLFSVVPFIIIIAIFFFMLNNMQGGANRGFGFGKSKAKLSSKDTPKTTFADVAGCDEAVEELHEIREFLAEPGKFQAIGAKIPKGVLLYGPPGTGKTLLARAVAGEAGVPFFSLSG